MKRTPYEEHVCTATAKALSGPSYFSNCVGDLIGCREQTFCWVDDTTAAVVFTRENLGPQRADDFHRDALTWGGRNSHTLFPEKL